MMRYLASMAQEIAARLYASHGVEASAKAGSLGFAGICS
jgi:hypothetical protein